MSRLCVSIAEPSVERALDQASRADLADWLEFRLDHLESATPEKLDQLFRAAKKPAMATCMMREEGGKYAGGRKERASLLFQAARSGAKAVDVDFSCAADLPDLPPGCLRIISRHDWKGTPESLEGWEAEMRPHGDLVKVVTTATKLVDNIVPLRLLERVKKPTLAFCMGEKGKISRALSPLWGGTFTYCAGEPGKETAPGQWLAADLRALYPNGAGEGTAIFGVVGSPLTHTLSPAVHMAGFRARNLDAIYLPLPAENFEEFARSFTSPRFRGFSITHPYKEAALALADESDSHARTIGAANTWLRKESGSWQALNTDADGGFTALAKAAGGPLRNKLVLILGTGGAARALAFECRRNGAEVVLAGRSPERTGKIAERLGAKAVEWDQIQGLPYDVLVQATPVGMFPEVDVSPIPDSWIRSGSVVMDLIYNPRETRLLKGAKARGAQAVSGLEMFLGQAAKQFRYFSGGEPPLDIMRAVAEAALQG